MYDKLRYWIKNNKDNAVTIKLDNIKLTDEIHKQGEFTNTFNKYSVILPLVVKKLNDTDYSLIANWKAYQYCLYQNKKSTSCIIVDYTRDEFFSMIETVEIPVTSVKIPKFNKIMSKIGKILISKEFKRTKPRQEKIDKFIQMYKINGKFDKHIVINKNKLLIDGYARYLAAEQLGLKSVEVIQQMN